MITTTCKDQIVKAVAAHGMWKARLQNAIDTGKIEQDPKSVECDNLCEFGKWMHGPIDVELKSMPDYRQVLDQHASFHKIAAKVLRAVQVGQKDEAKKLMDTEYTNTSMKLVQLLSAWKNK
jgi:methyl-accepting chemotaxis protein